MCQRWIVGLFVALMVMVPHLCHADLRSATVWFDTNAVGSAPDWHYRVPISIPAGTSVNSTIRIDVDFFSLLTTLGISGTFDSNSPRIVNSSGALAAIQQFTDAIFMGGTDALGNSRGEVRFILEDSGPSTCYLYFDIVQNGPKTPWSAANTINGNFEFSTVGQTIPAGWAAIANAGFDAQVRPSETPSINSDTTGGATPFVTTDGTPHTGQLSYLLGARTQNEPGNGSPAVTLSRTFTVAATNPGDLTLRYRLEGWDSSADGANQYDFIRIRLVGSSSVEMVGPAAGNYGMLPFSPNYGTTPAGWNQSGYGQYNGWDTDTNGNHHYSPAMTLTQGSEPWFTVSANLNAYAGQTVTLEITSSHYNQYRSWVHIDDVQWSVVAGTLGSPQAFGTNVTSPLTAAAGSTLSITAAVDAQPASLVALVLDDTGSPVVSGIVLYDDGSHGDAVANDGSWTNDGSDAGSPTTTIPAGTTVGVQWTTLILALDGSGSIIGATNGVAHIPGQPASPESQVNYFNIDAQSFTIVEPAPDLSTSTKSVIDLNGGSLYPGDILRYTIAIVESAGVPAAGIRVTDVIPAHLSGFDITTMSVPAGATNDSTFDGTGPNGSGYLDVSGISLAAGGSAAIVFEVTVDTSAATGTTIDNTAGIKAPGGTGANPVVSSPPVSAIPATGNKQLYLYTDSDLSRELPTSIDHAFIIGGDSNSWVLSPELQLPLMIDGDSGFIPIRLMLRKNSSNNGFSERTLNLALSSTGATSRNIGLLNDQDVLLNNVIREFTFMIPVSGDIYLDAGSSLVLTVSNTSSNNRSFRVYTTSGGANASQVQIEAETVINVDSVSFYDEAYPAGTMVTSAPTGNTVYVRSVVSDPFGSFDISGATVEITGPSGTTTYPMTQEQDSGAATKIFETPLTLPAFGSDGTWTALVTATEGAEGTIIHQGTATLLVGAPLLTVLKSANSATAVPGDLITYTIQVVNTGTGPAINIELDDAMSPYTALRIAYDGSGVLPFTLVGATGGMALGTPAYSDNGGATFTYSPLASGGSGAPAGYDGSVTHWRLPMVGTLKGGGSGFTMRYQAVVK